MLILGVDPGSRVTGWGLVRVQGARSQHVASGVFSL
ncbi:MAG TPA: crossover junction endodeoxyribonuclease RuvC, partial [bacterium]|nr:crossover junction endodeoxyribonuclease RuvC [bacterium]